MTDQVRIVIRCPVKRPKPKEKLPGTVRVRPEAAAELRRLQSKCGLDMSIIATQLIVQAARVAEFVSVEEPD